MMHLGSMNADCTAAVVLLTKRSYKGVISNYIGPPIDTSRAKGYDIGIVLTLEQRDYLRKWRENPERIRYAVLTQPKTSLKLIL